MWLDVCKVTTKSTTSESTRTRNEPLKETRRGTVARDLRMKIAPLDASHRLSLTLGLIQCELFNACRAMFIGVANEGASKLLVVSSAASSSLLKAA
jgi:hypothetical protein